MAHPRWARRTRSSTSSSPIGSCAKRSQGGVGPSRLTKRRPGHDSACPTTTPTGESGILLNRGWTSRYLCRRTYRFTEEGADEAVALARQALAIDPSYAPAAAMVGWCRVQQRAQGWGALSDEDIGEASRLARQAIELAATRVDSLGQGLNGNVAWDLSD